MTQKIITRIKLHNFKKFKDFSTKLDEKLNIFVGENEAGKSSILSAIDLTISGSRHKVEKIGIERLFNSEVIAKFLAGERTYENLPILYVELWLNEQNDLDLNGKQHSENSPESDGLRMEISPREDLSKHIKELLEEEEAIFPLEYYTVKFNTFSGDSYTGYKKHLRHIIIDTTQMGTEYATREYIANMYDCHLTSDAERYKHQNEYRRAKDNFKESVLQELNDKINNYDFALKHDIKSNLLTDITLLEDNIDIDNKGRGKQCFIKTEFALSKVEDDVKKIDIALIEEPENHLSHVNMKKLIQMIRMSDDKQIIIATHSNLISSRLDLRHAILLHNSADIPVTLEDLSEETAKFFIKAPDHGILNFVLSKKIILVEGDAEYMLMERFYNSVKDNGMETNDVNVISVDGTSFKRYLDIAKLLKIKVAVIRDNDKNYESNCVALYDAYTDDSIKVFGDQDNDRYTFEVCVYKDNKILCDSLFSEGRRTLSVEDYMIKNKTEAAFKLLESSEEVVVPKYIKGAIEWISA